MDTSDQDRKKLSAKWLYALLAAVLLLLLAGLLAVWIQNRHRVNAYEHLRRDGGVSILLDTWQMSPAEALKSFPAGQTAMGVRNGPDWLETISGRLIINARLVGKEANDTDLDALEEFPELEYLELINTSVTEDGVAKLREALPNCEIHWDGT